MYRIFTLRTSEALLKKVIPFTSLSRKWYATDDVKARSSGTTLTGKPIRVNMEEGISEGLVGFGHYAGSITAFVKKDGEKKVKQNANESLPCGVASSKASLQAMQAKLMAEAAMTGNLPSPRRRPAGSVGQPASNKPVGSGVTEAKSSSLPRHATREVKRPTNPKSCSSSNKGAVADAADSKNSKTFVQGTGTTLPGDDGPAKTAAQASDAEEYYSSISANQLSKEDLWERIKRASTEQATRQGKDTTEMSYAITAEDIDFVRMEEELKQMDSLHYSLGELAYPDETTRRNYYAMWYLAISLNKARWNAMEVQSQRGMKSTGAGMKLLFWKEAVNSIIEKRSIISGQFTDSHPVLRPFGSTVSSTPHMTKAFVRGFTDARLRVIQQPGNVKQLFDHFDKFYGYFFYSLMEATHVKDENAEHMMQHIGRAIGLVTHSVMLWKKYVRLGVTMLPADLCADNHVNLALLKNIPLASQDGGVRKLLYDVMCIAKTEMLNAQRLAPLVPPKAWPVVMECLYPNYYLGFLQRRKFNVSAMFADYNIENPGLVWYRLKKRWEWEAYQSIEKLVDESAPLPWIRTSLFHSPSRYKMATKSEKNAKSSS